MTPRRQDQAQPRPLRQLRLHRPDQGVPGRAPGHRDHRADRGLLRPPQEPRRAPGHRRRRRGHRGDRHRVRRPVQGDAGQVRRPQHRRRRQAQGPLAGLEVVGVAGQGRAADRLRHRRRRPGHLLPPRPVPGRRAARRPRRRLRALADLAGVLRRGQALPGQGAERRQVDGRRPDRAQRDLRPGPGRLLRPERPASSSAATRRCAPAGTRSSTPSRRTSAPACSTARRPGTPVSPRASSPPSPARPG